MDARSGGGANGATAAEREQLLAQHSALQLVEGGFRTTLTSLLLRTQLALLDPALSVEAQASLREVVSLTMELSRMIKRPEEYESIEILELCHLGEDTFRAGKAR